MTNSRRLPQLPVVLIACAVFKNLLENLLPDDLAAEVTFLDYGLHAIPKKLNIAIQEALDAIEEPSLIVLGYGLCGNGLDGIQAGKHTLLIPRADDCIAIFLGSYAAYRREFDENPGTYYLTKGWLESGSDPLNEYEGMVEKYGQETADWLMNVQYQHYKRLLFVAHTQEELGKYGPRARKVGAYMAQWGVQYEEINGSDAYLRQLASVACDLELADSDFLVIYPGYEFKVVDAMITNFHLPESTLIMLISALADKENVMNAYNEAVKEKYRFFSFGDAMFIK